MNYCKQCGSEYEPQRSTSRYCSPSCRKLAFQVSVPELSVPAVPQNAKTLHEINCTERGVNVCNVGGWKSSGELGQHELNRVALPGDVDYVGFWTG